MKKLLVVLVSISLVSNGSLYSMTKIKKITQRGVAKVGQFGTNVAAKTRRHWRCLTNPAKHGCSAEERKKARKWLIYTPTAIVVSLLVTAGIVATRPHVDQMKFKAAQMLKEKSERLMKEVEESEKEAQENKDRIKGAVQMYAAYAKWLTDDKVTFSLMKTSFEEFKKTVPQLQKLERGKEQFESIVSRFAPPLTTFILKLEVIIKDLKGDINLFNIKFKDKVPQEIQKTMQNVQQIKKEFETLLIKSKKLKQEVDSYIPKN